MPSRAMIRHVALTSSTRRWSWSTIFGIPFPFLNLL
jgi:hypothetical protein